MSGEHLLPFDTGSIIFCKSGLLICFVINSISSLLLLSGLHEIIVILLTVLLLLDVIVPELLSVLLLIVLFIEDGSFKSCAINAFDVQTDICLLFADRVLKTL